MSVSLAQNPVAYSGTAAQTNMTFTLGSAPALGNTLFMVICYYTGDNPLLVPAGWTLYRRDESGQVGIGVFTRNVQPGDGTSWNVTVLTVADQNSGFMFEVTGQNPSLSHIVNNSGNAMVTTANTTITSAAVIPKAINTLALSFTLAVATATTDVASTPAGWTKLAYAASTFQPAWMYRLNGLTPDNAPIQNTVSSLPSGQLGTTILLISSNSPSFKQATIRPHLFSPGLAR